MLERVKRYFSCRCHGTGKVNIEVRIPWDELTPVDKADILVNGGYCYRIVKKPCPFCKER